MVDALRRPAAALCNSINTEFKRKHFHLSVFLGYHHLNGFSADMGEQPKMTQTQMIQALADKIEVPKKTAKAMLDHLSQTAIAEVKKNGVFVIPGIGRLVKL